MPLMYLLNHLWACVFGAVHDATIGNLSTRLSWFTKGMAGLAKLDWGRGLRTKCRSLSKPTWNHHERRQNNSVENVFQRFEWSFVSFFRRKHDFRRSISTFVWRIIFEEPRISEALCSAWELAFWSPWPRLMSLVILGTWRSSPLHAAQR